MSPLRILLLGGTTEASAIARALCADNRFAPVLSYAGRTRHPTPQPVPVRVGGFGGVPGLRSWMADNNTDVLVDATHPFAARMHANAAAASREAAVTFLRVQRPPWQPGPGDRWTVVPDATAAVSALGHQPRRVFLTVGGTDLIPFAAVPHHWLVRAVDPPATLLPGARLLIARGPFDADAETDLLRRERVDVLVTKNSGGTATAGKLEAARRLRLPVVMIDRPPAEPAPATVPGTAEALAFLHAQFTLRGV